MTATFDTKEGKRRFYCNHCGCDTNHVARGEHRQRYEEVEGSCLAYWEETVYRLWTCAGCDTGTLEEAWTCSSSCDQNEKQIYTSTYHPKRAAADLHAKRYKRLPDSLLSIYVECIKSFNAGLSLLCAAGLRALVEGICEDKKMTGRTLEKRIGAMSAVLPQNIVDSLHGFRFMGNDALHKLAGTDRACLRVAIEVCEDLLNFLYEPDYKAQMLPRKRGKPKAANKENVGSKMSLADGVHYEPYTCC